MTHRGSDRARGLASGRGDPISVCLIEDDRRSRDALQALIGSAPGLSCLEAWASVEQALAARTRSEPDVILLDIHLPGVSGVEGLPHIRDRFPAATVLMLTVLEDEDRIFEALCHGAGGYLLKKTPPSRLLDHITEAATGGAPMSPEIARKVIRLLRDLGRPRPKPASLSPQETRFLALLADGHGYQSAADELGVSVNTVRNYVRSIYDKLHVHSKAAAVSKAIRAGLI